MLANILATTFFWHPKAEEKTFTTVIDACSLAKFSGTAQTRAIIALTPDELKYWNPVTTSGTTAEVLWKRVT